MRRILLALLLYAVSPLLAQAPAGFVTVTGTRILDAGLPLAHGTISAQFMAKGQAFNATLSIAGGQVTSTPHTASITAGAFTLFLPDTAHTNPLNACLAVTISDQRGNSIARYPCVQPSSATSGPSTAWCSTVSGATTCNFDLYSQALPGLAMATPGPPGAPGPSGSSVNAQYLDANGNLTIPPTGSVSGSAPVTYHFPSFGSAKAFNLDCPYDVATEYTNQIQLGQFCHHQTALFTEPGWNSYSSATDPLPAVQRHLVLSAHQVDLFSFSSGITNGLGLTAQKTSDGDFNVLDVNVATKGAITDGGDEGVVPARVQTRELTAPALGTALASSTGSTLLAFNCTANCGNLGSKHPLIDTNPATVVSATTATPQAIVIYPTGAPQGSYALLTFPGTPFSVSSCAVLAADVTTPQLKANQKTNMAVSFASDSRFTWAGFAAGAKAVFGGPAFWESAVLAAPSTLAGGAQTATAALTYPHDHGGIVCVGGMAGRYAEQAAFTAATGVRYVFYVLGSPTANTVMVAMNGPGYFSGYFLPGTYTFYQGATVTDLSGPSGIRAIVNRTSATGVVNGFGTGPVSVGLDVNTMAVSAGDPLSNASLAGAIYSNLISDLDITNPFAQSTPVVSRVRHASQLGQPTFSAETYYTPQDLASGLLHASPLLQGNSVNGGPYAFGAILNEYPVGGIFQGNGVPPCAFACFFGGSGVQHGFDIFGDYKSGSYDLQNNRSNAIRWDPAGQIMTFNIHHLNLSGITTLPILDSATSGSNVGVVHTLTFCNGALVTDASTPCGN